MSVKIQTRSALTERFSGHLPLLRNATSLVGTTVVTSGLGFIFWWLAARLFSPEEIGLSSAAISTMTLLGTFSMLGFGTLLMGELPRRPANSAGLIFTALLTVMLAGGLTGLGFGLGAGWFSPELKEALATPIGLALFAGGVALTAAGLVADQAVIGLLWGGLQLWRNGLLATIKLLILPVAAIFAGQAPLLIYSTWVFGSLASLVVLGFLLRRKNKQPNSPLVGAYRFELGLLGKLGKASFAHHALNLAIQAPLLTLPLLVTALLSSSSNGAFYIAWMIAGLGFVAPVALSTVLYAVGSSSPELLAKKLRFTLRLSFLLTVVGSVGLILGSDLLLTLFGKSYAQQADDCLRLLAVAAFPLIIKDHFISLARIKSRIKTATLRIGVGGAVTIGLAAAGGIIGGLNGLTLGWVLGVTGEALLMLPAVYRAARA